MATSPSLPIACLVPDSLAMRHETDDVLLEALSMMNLDDPSPRVSALLALAVARGLKKPKRNKAHMSKKRRKAKMVSCSTWIRILSLFAMLSTNHPLSLPSKIFMGKISRGIADAERIQARVVKAAATKAKKVQFLPYPNRSANNW